MIVPVSSRLPMNPSLPPLAVGDVLSVKVMGAHGGKFTILLNGAPMEAESSLPLQVGERVTVRIASLEPRIVLVPMGIKRESSDEMKIVTTHLRLFHQEPKVLDGVLSSGVKLFMASQRASYRGIISDSLLAAIREKFDAVFDHSMDVGKCAAALGLFHERDIARGSADSSNLKALLLKLDAELKQLPSPTRPEMAELSRWVKAAMNRIEACQVVNVFNEERGGLCYLPIPFLFGEEVRVGDFFSQAKKTAKGKEFAVWIALDFPQLGPIMVELRLVGKKLSTLIRCERVETRDELIGKIESMGEKLREAGYEISALGCTVEAAMGDRQRDIWMDVPAYQEGTVQVKV